ncbi:MAG: hypothetical protein JJE53_01850 [Candidatus Pacebacteria bacterium]|nr:hypothetical protein [Candidatus Paceibacterota bacterium]
MKTKVLFLVALISVFFLTSCSNSIPASSRDEIKLGIKEQVVIPEGYKLIEASSYGQFDNSLTLYIENNENGYVYQYIKSKIGAKITVPEGYKIVAVSAYGKFDNNVTFYCQNVKTNEVFACR